MGSIGDTNFILAQDEQFGEVHDVRVKNNAEGITEVTVARDPKITSPRTYVVDRRLLPDAAWQRLLETDAFSEDASPDFLSETRVEVTYEDIVNDWQIPFERCFGLPEGMESPWVDPVEMVENELLLKDTKWVSGDAPVNTVQDNYFENGKYGVKISDNILSFFSGDDLLGEIETDGRFLQWNEGFAGAAFMRGGSLWIEPAKPATFTGTFSILGDTQPEYQLPGLYRYGDYFIISSVDLHNSNTGTIAFIKDPFPERWIPRLMGRAYLTLVSPSNKPPFVEEEPERLSIRVEYPETDFTSITPSVVTPYSDKTGIFNSWEVEREGVDATPRERPYDIYLPFERLEDWGGLPVETNGAYYPEMDFKGEESAAYPNEEGYTIPDTPAVAEGVMFYRWKDSAHFKAYEDKNLDVEYREGYIYYWNKHTELQGIANIDVTSDWQNTKIEWNATDLYVNDKEALTEKNTWEEWQDYTWAEVLGYDTASQWEPNPDIPLDVEQSEEFIEDWQTGVPEGYAEPPEPSYEDRPITHGRVLHESYENRPSDTITN